jgi:hypothetical protein
VSWNAAVHLHSAGVHHATFVPSVCAGTYVRSPWPYGRAREVCWLPHQIFPDLE